MIVALLERDLRQISHYVVLTVLAAHAVVMMVVLGLDPETLVI